MSLFLQLCLSAAGAGRRVPHNADARNITVVDAGAPPGVTVN